MLVSSALRTIPITLLTQHQSYGATSSTRRLSARPGLRRVGSDRRQQSNAGGAQSRLRDAKALHQFGCDGFGAALRQVEIVFIGALAVGVADDEDVELRLARQQL